MGEPEIVLERSGSIARVILNLAESFAFRGDDHKRRLAAFRGQRRAKS